MIHGTHVSCAAETLCDNREIIETNIRSVKISSPDVGVLVPLTALLLIGCNSIADGIQIKPWKITMGESGITRTTTRLLLRQLGLIFE